MTETAQTVHDTESLSRGCVEAHVSKVIRVKHRLATNPASH
jgi:hypothetical protein